MGTTDETQTEVRRIGSRFQRSSRLLTLISVVILAALVQYTSLSEIAEKRVGYRSENLSVDGIRLGMSKEEAYQALELKGRVEGDPATTQRESAPTIHFDKNGRVVFVLGASLEFEGRSILGVGDWKRSWSRRFGDGDSTSECTTACGFSTPSYVYYDRYPEQKLIIVSGNEGYFIQSPQQAKFFYLHAVPVSSFLGYVFPRDD